MSADDIELAESDLFVRIDPESPSQYPSQATRDGLKGWVMLSYNIDASPKRIFDHEARRALAK